MARLQPGTILIAVGFGLLWMWQKTQNLLARLGISFGGLSFAFSNWSPKVNMTVNSPFPTSITLDTIVGQIKNKNGVVLANYYMIGPINIAPGVTNIPVTIDLMEGNLITNASTSIFDGATFFYTLTAGPLSFSSSYQYA